MKGFKKLMAPIAILAGISSSSYAAEPVDIAISCRYVEAEVFAGQLIGVFNAADADLTDTFSFSLVGGAGDTDNSRFEIVGNRLYTKEAFVYDAGNKAVSIRVRVQDSGGESFVEALNLEVMPGPSAWLLFNQQIGNELEFDDHSSTTRYRGVEDGIGFVGDTLFIQDSPIHGIYNNPFNNNLYNIHPGDIRAFDVSESPVSEVYVRRPDSIDELGASILTSNDLIVISGSGGSATLTPSEGYVPPSYEYPHSLDGDPPLHDVSGSSLLGGWEVVGNDSSDSFWGEQLNNFIGVSRTGVNGNIVSVHVWDGTSWNSVQEWRSEDYPDVVKFPAGTAFEGDLLTVWGTFVDPVSSVYSYRIYTYQWQAGQFVEQNLYIEGPGSIAGMDIHRDRLVLACKVSNTESLIRTFDWDGSDWQEQAVLTPDDFYNHSLSDIPGTAPKKWRGPIESFVGPIEQSGSRLYVGSTPVSYRDAGDYIEYNDSLLLVLNRQDDRWVHRQTDRGKTYYISFTWGVGVKVACEGAHLAINWTGVDYDNTLKGYGNPRSVMVYTLQPNTHEPEVELNLDGDWSLNNVYPGTRIGSFDFLVSDYIYNGEYGNWSNSFDTLRDAVSIELVAGPGDVDNHRFEISQLATEGIYWYDGTDYWPGLSSDQYATNLLILREALVPTDDPVSYSIRTRITDLAGESIEQVFTFDVVDQGTGETGLLETRRFGDSMYAILGNRNTGEGTLLQDSIRFAETNGGHLVTINDVIENQLLTNSFAGQSYLGQPASAVIHIGLTDSERNTNPFSGRDFFSKDEGNFRWLNGTDVNYLNWAEGTLVNHEQEISNTYAGWGVPTSGLLYNYNDWGVLIAEGSQLGKWADRVNHSTSVVYAIAEFPLTSDIDLDNDELPDWLEQIIVDADPDDAIRSIYDVHSSDDFDNDGEDNGSEIDANQNPASEDDAIPPVAVTGARLIVYELDGDGYEDVLLDGSYSYDANGEIVDWKWTWEGGEGSGRQIPLNLELGTHSFTLEVTDNDGLSHSTPLLVIVTHPDQIEPQTPDAEGKLITRAEYFIDEDPGFGRGTPIPLESPPVASIAMESFQPDVSGLLPGGHTLYLRAQNERGHWSMLATHSFFVTPFAAAAKPELVAAEWFDGEDPGYGEGNAIDFTPGAEVAATIPVGTLADGSHQMYVRFKDALGNWSMPVGHGFYQFPQLLPNAIGWQIRDGETVLAEGSQPINPAGASFTETIETDPLPEDLPFGNYPASAWLVFEDSFPGPALTIQLRIIDITLDSDGDGLPDYIETNSGVWVSATDTGTDPYRADSDGDLLTDGEEVDLSLDPNVSHQALVNFFEQKLGEMNVGTPIIQSDDEGNLSIRLQLNRSENLETWNKELIQVEDVSLEDGDLMIRIPQPNGGALFYRLSAD